jgi:hypothetical protein
MLKQPIKHRLKVFGKRSEMAISADYFALGTLTEIAMAGCFSNGMPCSLLLGKT